MDNTDEFGRQRNSRYTDEFGSLPYAYNEFGSWEAVVFAKDAFQKMNTAQREKFVEWMLDNGLEEVAAIQTRDQGLNDIASLFTTVSMGEKTI